MQNTIHIWPLEQIEENGKITVNAMIEQDNGQSFRLWFSVPIEHKENLCQTCDPFVIALIFYAMRNSGDIYVHGQISPSLLRNLEEFQGVWTNWVPQIYSKIDIKATNELEPENRNHTDKAIMAFSGGLDSCFTAYRHKTENSGRQKRDITAGIFVHGFDIPLKDEEAFKRAAEKNETIVKSLDIKLIRMATNFREIGDYWPDAHCAAVAASLALFQNKFKYGIIASSFSYDAFQLNIPWGSNPLTDAFLSSKGFEIFNDGSMFDRTKKIELIANWPQAMENMRVCWEGENLEQNCCKCEKCIRNILGFHVLGMDIPKSFGQRITERQIEYLRVPDMAILFEYKCMLDEAKQRGIMDGQVRAIEKCIKRNENLLNGSSIDWNKIRAKIALRTRLRKLYRAAAAMMEL